LRKFNRIKASQTRDAKMEQTRFVETGNSTLFGEYLYDQVIPQDHFFADIGESSGLGIFHQDIRDRE
jgi:hypothetical protein